MEAVYRAAGSRRGSDAVCATSRRSEDSQKNTDRERDRRPVGSPREAPLQRVWLFTNVCGCEGHVRVAAVVGGIYASRADVAQSFGHEVVGRSVSGRSAARTHAETYPDRHARTSAPKTLGNLSTFGSRRAGR